MHKNISHKSFRYFYLLKNKIGRKIIEAQKSLQEEQVKVLKSQELVVIEQFTIAKDEKKKYLTNLNNRDKNCQGNLNTIYNDLSMQRDKWIEQANLIVAPDGKLKTLNKLNNIGQRKAQRVVKRMIKVGEKMQYLSNRINARNEVIKQINDDTFIPLSKLEIIRKFWRSIPYNKQQKIWGYIFVFPWVVGFIVFFFLPICSTLWWSLNDVKPEKGSLAISWCGFSNYKALFTSYVDVYGNTFAEVLSNSLVSLTFNLIIVVIFSLIIAVLLNTKFKGHNFVKAIFFIPVIFNATAIAFALEGLGGRLSSSMSGNFTIANDFNILLGRMSLPDSFTNFLVTAVNQIFTIVNMSGVQILIFLAAIQSVPTSLYEVAKMEGATKYEIFWKITFPMVSPIFLTAAIYTIIDGFSRSPILNFYESSKNLSQYGIASSVAVIYFLFNIIFIGIVYYIMKARLFYYDER